MIYHIKMFLRSTFVTVSDENNLRIHNIFIVLYDSEISDNILNRDYIYYYEHANIFYYTLNSFLLISKECNFYLSIHLLNLEQFILRMIK